MTNERPNVTRDGHYCLSDTARILSVSTQTLRRHTQLGLITCSRWSHNGRAFYTGKEILRYWRENKSHSDNLRIDNDSEDGKRAMLKSVSLWRDVERQMHKALSMILAKESTSKTGKGEERL